MDEIQIRIIQESAKESQKNLSSLFHAIAEAFPNDSPEFLDKITNFQNDLEKFMGAGGELNELIDKHYDPEELDESCPHCGSENTKDKIDYNICLDCNKKWDEINQY